MKNKILILVLVLIVTVVCNAQPYGWKWEIKNSGTSNDLKCAFSLSVNAALICGSNGTVLYTTDGHNSYTQKQTGTTANLNSIIRVINSSSFLCCGDNGTLIYSANTGSNWTQINTGTTANLKSMVAYPYNSTYKLFVIGDGGIILFSTWTGTTWSSFTQLPSTTNQSLNSITANGNSDATICGNSGTVLKSSNGGMNWYQVTSPTIQNLNYVNGYGGSFTVYGNNGVIYGTYDTGRTWISGMSGITNDLFYNDSYSTVGSGGTVLMFNNNWYRINTPVTTNLYYTIYPYYYFGGGGTILKYVKDTIFWQRKLEGNNISSYFSYKGVFNQNYISSSSPGFEWPKGSGRYAVFTTGLSMSAMVQGQLRQAMSSYKGEMVPGICNNGTAFTNDTFKIYTVKKTDSPNNNPDWLNWGLMVPYGAPFVDVNNNGMYEPFTDTPGVKNASQTIFVCMTDGFPYTHTSSEYFGGGTQPLYNEVHLTAWCYSQPSYNDMQFLKYEIINKSNYTWNRTYFSFVADPDLGDAVDDYIGCDTIRKLGFCYNADDMDGTGSPPSYGAAPPAVGFLLLKSAYRKYVNTGSVGMTGFTTFGRYESGFMPCEWDPTGVPLGAYYFMMGLKSDSTFWLDPTQSPKKKTKLLYAGDPETNTGWTEFKGRVMNCGNDTLGTIMNVNPPHDQRFAMSTGSEDLTVMPGDTQRIVMCQLIARGSSNLNSVTKLKQLSDVAIEFYNTNFTIGVNQISTEIPSKFSLSQNYPNPFNSTSKMKFEIANSSNVRIVIYDIMGREIQTLVNERLQPGTYEVGFNGSMLSSGVYFYQLQAGEYRETRKMLMLK